MNKVDELIELLKMNTGMLEKKQPKKKCNGVACVLGIIAALVAIAVAVYAAYRYFGPSYLEDFDDDYEDDYDDDFFEDEEEEECEEKPVKQDEEVLVEEEKSEE